MARPHKNSIKEPVRLRAKNLKLTDWIDQYRDTVAMRNPGSSYHLRFRALRKHIETFQPHTLLKDIDRKYCERLIEYFKQVQTPSGTPLTNSTIENYLTLFNAVLNSAYHEEIIAENPMRRIDPKKKPKGEKSLREYLTIDELKRLMETPAKNEEIKQAFLFCCFCGLRFSDVSALTWGNITEENGYSVARIIVKKTRQPLHIPLSAEALRWLPKRGEAKDSDKVFNMREYPTVRGRLKRWVDHAGIRKHITFHVARHTFATLMLTLGADLYTTSKLLGHSKVTTTQIYAKIVDEKKVEAVNLVTKVFS